MLRNVLLKSSLAKNSLRRASKNAAVRTFTVSCAQQRIPLRCTKLSPGSHQQCVTVQVIPCRFYADVPDHTKVTLPALSPTMETGTIVSWSKKEGDQLNEGDLLAEIETDKATMGFETPEEGYLAKILVPAGTKDVPIGKLVCIIVQKESDVAAFKDYRDDGTIPAVVKPAGPSIPAPAQFPPQPAPAAPVAAAAAPSDQGRVYASPMAKRLAEQHNIRLQGKGTGLFGSITSSDLPKAGEAPAARAQAAPPSGPSFSAGQMHLDIPVTGIRATIAKRLLQSKQQIPHYYLSIDTNIDKLVAMKTRMNKRFVNKDKDKAIKLSFNDFVIKAASVALRRVPEVNSAWMESFIRQYKHADISVAVATDRGLITPIIFEADVKGVVEISKEVKALAKKAREGTLKPQEYQGGSFTISNLGMFHVNSFSAIINPPQTCILAVGTSIKRLVLDETSEKGFKQDQFVEFTISCDHRVIDGAIGARFLQAFRECIEEPELMLL